MLPLRWTQMSRSRFSPTPPNRSATPCGSLDRHGLADELAVVGASRQPWITAQGLRKADPGIGDRDAHVLVDPVPPRQHDRVRRRLGVLDDVRGTFRSISPATLRT